MNIFSIDQSKSKCAIIVWSNDQGCFAPIYKEVIRSGNNGAKAKQKVDVMYFDTLYEQIYYVVSKLEDLYYQYEPEYVCLEGLGFSSIGDQTRDLAGVYHCIYQRLMQIGVPISNITSITPTSAKSFARQFLPSEEQTEEYIVKKGKKAGQTQTRKTVMDKHQMVKACKMVCPELLVGYTSTGLNSGIEDLADAYFIGRCFIETHLELQCS